VISVAAATTQITPRTTAGELIAHGKRPECFAPAEFFNRLDRCGGFAFFTRSDILFNESVRSVRSAESKYRIDRGGLLAFFTRIPAEVFEPRSA
jgi:hypothetical protein